MEGLENNVTFSQLFPQYFIITKTLLILSIVLSIHGLKFQNCMIIFFYIQGQKCSACSRMYVPESLWPKIKEGLIETHKTLKVNFWYYMSIWFTQSESQVIKPSKFDSYFFLSILSKNFAFRGLTAKQKGCCHFIKSLMFVSRTVSFVGLFLFRLSSLFL